MPAARQRARAPASSSNGVSRANCASGIATATWRPKRWGRPGRQRPRRSPRRRRPSPGPSRRSRGAITRGASTPRERRAARADTSTQRRVVDTTHGMAARSLAQAGVGDGRRVGIRAHDACRRPAVRSTHHGRPRPQAHLELRAIWTEAIERRRSDPDRLGFLGRHWRSVQPSKPVPSWTNWQRPRNQPPDAWPPPRQEPTVHDHQPDISTLA